MPKRLYIPLPNFNSRKQLINNVVNREKEKGQYLLNDDDIDSVVKKTMGYSGSDMMGVCREAAMMPIRSIEDIYNIKLDSLRGVNVKDFIDAIFFNENFLVAFAFIFLNISFSLKSYKSYLE
jgi:SpoVK/Ycf46/Vps4 family AAA+-type ATPase